VLNDIKQGSYLQDSGRNVCSHTYVIIYQSRHALVTLS